MKRSGVLVFGLITTALVVFTWLAFEQRGETQVPADSNATTSPIRGDTSSSLVIEGSPQQISSKSPTNSGSATKTKRRSAEMEAKELPGFEVPPDQAIARLRVLSEAGNNEARYQLSSRLADCTARAFRANQEFDESDRVSILMDLADQNMDEKTRTIRIDNSQRRIDQHASERAACEALPSEVLENWLDPIDEAAQSGLTYAMRQYAAFVVAEYDSREAVVADVDLAIIRRDKARAYLRQAASLGDAEALADLAHAYFNNHDGRTQLYATDNYQAYMYAYAGSFGARGIYRQLDWVMSRSAESLNAGQIADARKQGKRLFDACCINR